MKTVEFDAQGQVLGRLASRIAVALRGKDGAGFRPDRAPDVSVVVKNVDLVQTTGRKEEQKIYYRFSGYPGGLKRTRLRDLRKNDPTRALELAVRNMLPKNRLRAVLLKRLVLKLSTEE